MINSYFLRHWWRNHWPPPNWSVKHKVSCRMHLIAAFVAQLPVTVSRLFLGRSGNRCLRGEEKSVALKVSSRRQAGRQAGMKAAAWLTGGAKERESALDELNEFFRSGAEGEGVACVYAYTGLRGREYVTLLTARDVAQPSFPRRGSSREATAPAPWPTELTHTRAPTPTTSFNCSDGLEFATRPLASLLLTFSLALSFLLLSSTSSACAHAPPVLALC